MSAKPYVGSHGGVGYGISYKLLQKLGRCWLPPLQFFEPTPDGRNLAMLTGDIALRALAAAQATWSE
jgi:hypothetical protein